MAEHKQLTVLACGGRDYGDGEKVSQVLDALNAGPRPIGRLVHGAARGADNLAALWAMTRHVPAVPYQADWEKYGKAAGPLRNQRMLDNEQVDLVVAFPGGKGTRDMVQRARRKGIEVMEVRR